MEVKDIVYRTVFTHLDQVYTLYSKGVSEETLVGFIEVDSILSVSQDYLMSTETPDNGIPLYLFQMEGIKRTYVPMHAVVRIDELTRHHYEYLILNKDNNKANVQHIHGGKYSVDQ
jgi:hypothetical protein